MATKIFPKKKRMKPTKGQRISFDSHLIAVIPLYWGFQQIWARLFIGFVMEEADMSGRAELEKTDSLDIATWNWILQPERTQREKEAPAEG